MTPRSGWFPRWARCTRANKSLIARATSECGAVVVSIFVNPAQFAAGEDYDTYPRTFEADLETCREMGAACAYAPKASSMYPGGYDTWVDVPGLGAPLCGSHRAGHFRGVATVVLKLFLRVSSAPGLFRREGLSATRPASPHDATIWISGWRLLPVR